MMLVVVVLIEPIDWLEVELVFVVLVVELHLMVDILDVHLVMVRSL